MMLYGVVNRNMIFDYARAVCDVLGHGSTNQALPLLLRTCAQETGMGTVRDRHYRKLGVGLYQIDKISFDDIVARTRPADVAAIEKHFEIKLHELTHAELSFAPLPATVFARLHYKLKSEPIPTTLEAQAQYWKTHYNTAAGKGEPEDFIANAKHFGVI